jgi:demethylsterigmatocystin 6-O-methyltransferase
MEAIISQITSLAGAANEQARKKIIDQLRDLSYTLESADDVLQRVMYRVSKLEN